MSHIRVLESRWAEGQNKLIIFVIDDVVRICPIPFYEDKDEMH